MKIKVREKYITLIFGLIVIGFGIWGVSPQVEQGKDEQVIWGLIGILVGSYMIIHRLIGRFVEQSQVDKYINNKKASRKIMDVNSMNREEVIENLKCYGVDTFSTDKTPDLQIALKCSITNLGVINLDK